MDENLKKLMALDPLAEAEKLTGNSYKEDKETSALGFLLHMKKSEELSTILKDKDDTCFSETTENYTRIVERIGFNKVWEKTFSYHCGWDKELKTEKQFIYYHDAGVLLNFDTYRGSRNSANIYFQWKENSKEPRYFSGALSGCSGGYHGEGDNLFFIGDRDAREAIGMHMQDLLEQGTFIKPWKANMHIWLLNHGDTMEKMEDYKEEGKKLDRIMLENMKALPVHVQEVIKVIMDKKEELVNPHLFS